MKRFNLPGGRKYGPVGGWLERLRQWLASLRPRQRWAVIAGAPLALVIVLAVVVTAVALASGGGGNDKSAVSRTATPSEEGSSEGLLDEDITQLLLLAKEQLQQREQTDGLAGTNPEAPRPGEAEGDRLIIAKIGVDAPITMRQVGADGQMPKPEGPLDVVWYDFSPFQGLGGRPGVGGNTVLSGHVDYRDYGPAVFWELRNVEAGDEITVYLRDGSEYKYVVQWNRVIDSSSAAWNDIVASTAKESVTLITCAGSFDPATRSYDQRRVVWAVRVA
jgi:LPXTG-site transpeptidase (sortase) family protein